jgi:predicted GIY-YIG superfamily endonuclease
LNYFRAFLLYDLKGKGPWKMIFSMEVESRSEAIHMEQKLKGFKNRDRIKKWIETQSSK